MNYYIFKISGLTQRQSYCSDLASLQQPDWINQKEAEKRSIEHYKIELQKLPSFTQLAKKDKDNFLAGKYAKRFGFIDLIQKSNLKDILFVDMWKLYSNYAHCELIGLLQINSYGDSPSTINTPLFGALSNTLIVVSVMFQDFINILKNTKAENIDIPNLDEETISIMMFYYLSGTKKSN